MIIIPEIVITSIVLLAFGLLLVLAILRLRSREPVIFYLALYVILGLLSSLSQLMTLLSVTPLTNIITYEQVTEFGLLAMIVSFGALTLNFLKKKRNILIGYWVGGLVILVLWIVLAFNLGGWDNVVANFGVSQIGSSALILAWAGWLVAIATALIALSLDFRQRRSTQYMNRLRYWLIATTLLVVSGLIRFASPTPIFNWADLPVLMIGSILVGYTVLSYHTPDLKLLVGRALSYSGVTAMLSSLFFAGLAAAITITRNVPNSTNVLFLAIILAIFIAVIFPLAWRISNRVITRIVFGKQRHDEKQVIKHYGQSLSSALDMKRLGDIVINLMIETLGIEQGIVFINERGGTGDVVLRPLSSIGTDELTTTYFATDSPFIDHFRQGKKSLSQYDLEVLPKFRSLSKTERQWLSNLGMELYVPILRQRELVGLLGFGPQPQGTSYYDEDLDLMTSLADQTALAMDSARLFEQLAMINQEVGELTEQMAGLDQTKSDFLSIASHELRTPLTHIHGYSRMLLDLTEEELKDPAYLKTLIQGVVKGSERMKDVVDLMFDVTEANVGEMRLFTGPVNLEEVIDQASRPFLPVLDERRIAFGKIFKDLPVVEADGTRLVQAFENLIGNAVKYTPDGGTITVEGRSVVLDNIGSAVEIVVADTGIGIDPEHHERIFEKFFRIDDTMHHSTGKTKFKGAGPGLGLTLVKGIAETHGGRVWVESLGHDEINCPGSKFFFVIPLHAQAEATDEDGAEGGFLPKQSQIETRHWRRSDLIQNDQ